VHGGGVGAFSLRGWSELDGKESRSFEAPTNSPFVGSVKATPPGGQSRSGGGGWGWGWRSDAELAGDGTAGGELGKAAAAELEEKQRERRGSLYGRQKIDNQFKDETFRSGYVSKRRGVGCVWSRIGLVGLWL
jgi:hypothetical protein